MRRALLLTALLPGLLALGCGGAATTAPGDRTVIHGAGATFPNPLYQQWCAVFNQAQAETHAAYDSVGSGKGVERFLAGSVAFGASDAGLTDEQIAQAPHGAQLVPTCAGAITIVYNLPIKQPLKLSRDVYVDMFLGKITNWADPRILACNPGVEIPRIAIACVARQDGSGTTFAFTNHLSAISQEWKDGPGAAYKVDWPSHTMRAPGNAGVAATVQRSTGTLGYVEYGYASRLGMTMATLENKAGNYIRPSGNSGLATLLDAQLPANFRAFFPDPAGKDSYPIVTYTWLLLQRRYPDARQGEAVKQFVAWCLQDGQSFNESLGYIRLPPRVAADAARAVESIQVGP